MLLNEKHRNYETLVKGLEKLGIHPIIVPEYQSYIITTFELGKVEFSEARVKVANSFDIRKTSNLTCAVQNHENEQIKLPILSFILNNRVGG